MIIGFCDCLDVYNREPKHLTNNNMLTGSAEKSTSLACSCRASRRALSSVMRPITSPLSFSTRTCSAPQHKRQHEPSHARRAAHDQARAKALVRRSCHKLRTRSRCTTLARRPDERRSASVLSAASVDNQARCSLAACMHCGARNSGATVIAAEVRGTTQRTATSLPKEIIDD